MSISPPSTDQLVLRLQLLVGMAASDDVLDEAEAAALRARVIEWTEDPDERSRLDRRLDELLVAPPVLGDMLRQLVELEDRSLARALLDDLALLAHADGAIDPREEGMLRMVCGALELAPESLYAAEHRAAADVGAADLARLVRALIGVEENQ